MKNLNDNVIIIIFNDVIERFGDSGDGGNSSLMSNMPYSPNGNLVATTCSDKVDLLLGLLFAEYRRWIVCWPFGR